MNWLRRLIEILEGHSATQSFGKSKSVTCPRCGQRGSQQESGIIIHSTRMGSQWVHPAQAIKIYLARGRKEQPDGE